MIYNEDNQKTFDGMEDKSVGAVITDVPYNLSEIAKSCKMLGGFHNRASFQLYFGKWDTGFNPLGFIENSWRKLKPGGWLITFNGDRLLGAFRDFSSMDFSTIPFYASFMQEFGIIYDQEMEKITNGLEIAARLPKMFSYKATVTWHKLNPVTSVRKTTTVSSCEWIQIARRNNDDGSPAKALAWNWLGQNKMHNYFKCKDLPSEDKQQEINECIENPLTPPSERLYWHVHHVDGEIIPCLRRQTCQFCKSGMERKRHGTQKPLKIWKWIYDRYTVPGMKVYDPFAGTASSGVAAKLAGLDWSGSEIDPEYAKVAKMNLSGVWKTPVVPEGMQRIELF